MSTKIRQEQLFTVVSALARLILGVVWVYSGYTKIVDRIVTIQSVEAYQLFPHDISVLIGTALPPLEIALGVLILLGVFLRGVSIFSIVLFLVFIAGIISAWARGLTIDCGCFGSGGQDPTVTGRTYAWEIVRDLFFIFCAGWTAWKPWRKFAIYP